MAINFPGSLDNFTNPTSSSPINSPSHADQHANANDAIEALEAKVGIDGSSVVTSHDYKIAQLQSLVTSAVAGAKSIYQDVRNQSGSAFTKATPVYVSGSTGASGQLLVSAASNATEATSSKTMGITTSAISNNSNGQVISEGILEGIDTTGAADGDPVWLGVNGAKIYGLANKPSAPAHLVFLGIVIRGGQANTGSMYVKIQNGFELQEIHNVEISSLVNGNILAYDSTTQTWKNTNTLQSTSSTTPLVVKASASQSVDIFQIQNSSGTALAKISNVGNLTIKPIPFSGGVSGGIYLGDTSNAWADGAFEIKVNNAGTPRFGFRAPNAPTEALTIIGNSVGVQNSDPQAYLHVNSYNAGNKALIVQGYASQTANLQEWQNSNGTVLASIDANGQASFKSTTLTASSSGGSSLTLVAASGQTAPLLITSGGAQIPAGGNYFRAPGIEATYVMNVTSGNLGTIPFIVKGAASQTADLQQWQDSAGTVLAYVAANGHLLTPRLNITNGGNIVDSAGTTPYFAFGSNQIAIYARNAAYKPLVIQGAASQSANLQEWQQSDGTVTSYVGGDGNIFVQNARALFVNSGYIGSASLVTKAAGPTWSGLIVKAATSQTANLQEWQDSSGNILTGISSNGLIYSGKSYSSYNIESAGTLASSESVANTFNLQGKNNLLYPSTITSVGGNGWTSVTPNYGIAPDGTQTSTRYVWNSSGMCYTTPSLSNYNTYAGEIYTVSAYIKINAGTGSCALRYSTGDSSKVAGIKINLSTKTVTTILDASDYNVLSYSLIPIGKNWYRAIATIKILVGHTNDVVMFAATDNVGDVEVWGFQLERGLSASPLTPTTNALVTTINTLNIPYGQINLQSNASTIGLIIKSANAQTANLTEWQTNTGATIAYVDSNGSAFLNSNLRVNGVAAVGTGPQAYSQFIIQTNSATRNGLVIKAASSQTANIQEWQNNAGTILLSITSDGSIKGGNSNTISVNTASTIDTVALSSFTSMEYTLSIKQGSKIRSSKVLVHTDGTSVDSTEYGIIEMGGGITGILVTASVSGTDAILQITITDAATTNATVKLIKTML